MDKIITNYLDKYYEFNLSTLSSYKLYDKINKIDVSVKSILYDMEKIFCVTEEIFEPIWDKWVDVKITQLNNRITDIRYKLYELNGTEIEITSKDINMLLNV